MVEKNIKGHVYRYFSSIGELISFIDSRNINEKWKGLCISDMRGEHREKFTGTKSYEEARKLLLFGWEYGTEKIINEYNEHIYTIKKKRKNVYGVHGCQPCVPRFLNGLPDNMIRTETYNIKEKVVVINKDIMYSCHVNTDRIMNESAKVLDLVSRIEASGVRVRLNVIASFNKKRFGEEGTCVKVCTKKESQRLNIKQISFPLVHPSMLRRILFRYIECVPECNCVEYTDAYGLCSIPKKEEVSGEYLIPSIVEEAKIETIEKYKTRL